MTETGRAPAGGAGVTGTDWRGRLADRVVIVTGAAHGLGLAYARRLAAEGARVVVADIDGAAAEAAAAQIVDTGAAALGLGVDVRSPADLAAMAEVTLARFARIDVLINNAALFSTVPMSRSPFDQIEIEEWDRMMAINLRGPWLATRAVFPAMRAQRAGKIVNISSGTALKGSATRLHYVASKAGVLGLTKSLARELGPYGITVNCVAPGNTLSEAAPDAATATLRAAAAQGRALARVQTPADLEGAIVFFASADSDFITGQTLVVDGGAYMH